jgi:hypothetical protein
MESPDAIKNEKINSVVTTPNGFETFNLGGERWLELLSLGEAHWHCFLIHMVTIPHIVSSHLALPKVGR